MIMQVVHKYVSVCDEMTSVDWTMKGIDDIVSVAKSVALNQKWLWPVLGSGWISTHRKMSLLTSNNTRKKIVSHGGKLNDDLISVYDIDKVNMLDVSDTHSRCYKDDLGHMIVIGNCARICAPFKNELQLNLTGLTISVVMSVVFSSKRGKIVIDPRVLADNFQLML